MVPMLICSTGMGTSSGSKAVPLSSVDGLLKVKAQNKGK